MLKNPVGTGSNQIASAGFPFLGVLNINSRNDNIDEMTGLWYDIDNSILNLARMPALKGLDDLFHGIESGSVTFECRFRLPGFARWRGYSGNPHNGDGSALLSRALRGRAGGASAKRTGREDKLSPTRRDLAAQSWAIPRASPRSTARPSHRAKPVRANGPVRRACARYRQNAARIWHWSRAARFPDRRRHAAPG